MQKFNYNICNFVELQKFISNLKELTELELNLDSKLSDEEINKRLWALLDNKHETFWKNLSKLTLSI